MTSILIFATSAVTRMGLESLIRGSDSLTLESSASTIDGLAQALERLTPDVIVADMPARLDQAVPAYARSQDERFEDLTPREMEVLEMLAEALANKMIARRLGISEHTVKFHIASIFGKLGASTRTEAVTIGIRQGL